MDAPAQRELANKGGALPKGAHLPFFQPIISVSDGQIFGYEALGRVRAAGEIHSLGSFFTDRSVANEEKLGVDRRLREAALRRVGETAGAERFFLNIHPGWIYSFKDNDGEFPTLRMLRENGVAGNRIVIEITEEEIHGVDFAFLNRLIDRYREQGVAIAIDDFSYPNFDRLISIRPDFVKLDIRLVKQSVTSDGYRRLIHHISHFSQELGIAVIFEGVETLSEVEHAIEAGGSYLQGFFFARPQEDFFHPGAFNRVVRLALNNVIYRSVNYSSNILKIEKSMNRYLSLVTARDEDFESLEPDVAIERILEFLPPQCFRIFVCDGQGEQISANYTRGPDRKFERRSEFKGKNWGWRPYFFHNVVRMRDSRSGVISQKYIDVQTKVYTITFSYPLSQDRFAFIDFYSEM